MNAIAVLFSVSSLIPLQVPAEWNQQLEDLARKVAEGLRHPIELGGENTRSLKQFNQDLDLATSWPHPLFIDPLVGLLKCQNPHHVLRAAQALLNYGDADLRAKVEDLSGDRRTMLSDYALVSVGSQIRKAAAHPSGLVDFKPATDPILPVDHLGFPRFPDGIRVMTAVRALHEQNLSIRLQAFAWLVEKGIVFDIQPMLDAWSQLAPLVRNSLLGDISSARLCGKRVKEELEGLLEPKYWMEMSVETRGELLVCLAGMRSARAKALALAMAEERIESAKTLDDWKIDLLDPPAFLFAFDAVIKAAGPEDYERALQWSQSPWPVVRLAGLCVFARLDEPRAREAVLAFIRDKCNEFVHYRISPLHALRQRDWPSQNLKWEYLVAISASLSKAAQSLDDESIPERDRQWAIISLMDTLQDMTGELNQPSDFIPCPGGFDKKLAMDAAARWAKWTKKNDPRGRQAVPQTRPTASKPIAMN